ncbi:MAG: aquaporin family protein [Actinomycetia bacterium]|nr:aquaporin family protein [Actinomycetes bacterium]
MTGPTPLRSLGRPLLAEFVGTASLLIAVVGSGIMAGQLSSDVGLQLLENAIATGAALAALILAFGSVSGAHFNPVVSIADAWFGGITLKVAALYIVVQVVGAIAGVVVANLMFELDAVSWSTNDRIGSGTFLAEVVATVGLVVVIFGTVRSGRVALVPFAVAAYITGAYWFTASTSFANPAVTLGRMFSDTFAGIAPASVPGFLVAQLVGLGIAILFVGYLYPDAADVAADVIQPHDEVA